MKCYGCADIHFDLGDYMYKIGITDYPNVDLEILSFIDKEYETLEEAKQGILQLFNVLKDKYKNNFYIKNICPKKYSYIILNNKNTNILLFKNNNKYCFPSINKLLNSQFTKRYYANKICTDLNISCDLNNISVCHLKYSSYDEDCINKIYDETFFYLYISDDNIKNIPDNAKWFKLEDILKDTSLFDNNVLELIYEISQQKNCMFNRKYYKILDGKLEYIKD